MSSLRGVHRIINAERVGVLLGVIVGLVACAEVEIGVHALKSSGATTDATDEQRLAPVRVEPDAEGYALWSGFRTLDGAWIAHPMLPAPSRAYVRNTLNGRVVEAKLLRRDPATPGPMILLSADAARDLGIGPHRLTKVQIEVIGNDAPETEVASVSADEATAPASDADVSEAPLEPVETAAVGEPDGPIDDLAPKAGETGETAPASAPQTLAEIPAEPTPAASIPGSADAAPASLVENAATIDEPAVSGTGSSGVFRGDAPYELPGVSGGGDLPTAVEPVPAPAPPAVREPSAAAGTSAPAAPVQPVTRPANSEPARSSGQSYVQVVSFTSEGSASELATRLNAMGQPTLTDSGKAGESIWHRVLIGPLSGAEDAESALNAARKLGFADAFVVDQSAVAATKPAAPPPSTPNPVPVKPAPQPTSDKDSAKSDDPTAAKKAYVQVGSYSVADNAAAVASNLKGQGLPSFTAGGPESGSKWSRVLVGPLNGQGEVDRALQAAKSLGHSDAFVTRF